MKEILDIAILFEVLDETMGEVATLAREVETATPERRAEAANEIIKLVNRRLPTPASKATA